MKTKQDKYYSSYANVACNDTTMIILKMCKHFSTVMNLFVNLFP